MHSFDFLSTQRASSTDRYRVELSSFPKESSSSLGGRWVETTRPMAGPQGLGVLPHMVQRELGSLGICQTRASQREGVQAHLSCPCACWERHSTGILPSGSPFYWAVIEQPHVQKDRMTSWGLGGLESRTVAIGDAQGKELSKVLAAQEGLPVPCGS